MNIFEHFSLSRLMRVGLHRHRHFVQLGSTTIRPQIDVLKLYISSDEILPFSYSRKCALENSESIVPTLSPSFALRSRPFACDLEATSGRNDDESASKFIMFDSIVMKFVDLIVTPMIDSIISANRWKN